jgi:hypothetical protein
VRTRCAAACCLAIALTAGACTPSMQVRTVQAGGSARCPKVAPGPGWSGRPDLSQAGRLVPPGATRLVDCTYNFNRLTKNGVNENPEAGPTISGVSAVKGYVLLLDQRRTALVRCTMKPTNISDSLAFRYANGSILTVDMRLRCSQAVGADDKGVSFGSSTDLARIGLEPYDGFGMGKAVRVPDAVGKPFRQHPGHGFGATVDAELPDDEAAAATVLVQSPAQGSKDGAHNTLDEVVSAHREPACGAADLRASVTPAQAGTGTSFSNLILRTRRRTYCTLRGPVRLTATNSLGQPIARTDKLEVRRVAHHGLMLGPNLAAESIMESPNFPGSCTKRVVAPAGFLIKLSGRHLSGGDEIDVSEPHGHHRFSVTTCGNSFFSGPLTLAGAVDLP